MTHNAPESARPRRRGFTLIELLVVVGIITLLAAIALPNFMEAQMRTKVARMKNDMRTLSVAMETYAVDHGHYPMRRSITTMKNLELQNINGSGTNPDGTPADPDNQQEDNSWVWRSEANDFFWLSGVAEALPEKTSELDNEGNPLHPEMANTQARQLAALTTPIGYLNTLYVDMFENRSQTPNNLLDYWDPVQTMWFINSAPNMRGPAGGEGYNLSENAIKTPKEAGYMIVCVGPDGFIGHLSQNYAYMGWPRTPNRHGVNTMYRPYDPSNGTVSMGNIYLNPKMGGLDGVPPRLTTLKLLRED